MKTSILFIFLFFFVNLQAFASSTIDPIRFSIHTAAEQVSLNEEFEIEIKASYLNIPPNTAFVFEGSNSFRLKMVLPNGFEQTGGSFTDFTEAELSSSKPYISYTLKGKFTSSSENGIFQLLRSHKNSNNQSLFIEVAKLSFSVNGDQGNVTENNNARISLAGTPGFVPYLTIQQLRAGAADTAQAVFITDPNKYGMFRYNSTSSLPDDGALVIVSSGKRYERVYDGIIDVTWFDIKGDGVTDNTIALQALVQNPKYQTIYFPRSTSSYRIRAIKIFPNKTLIFQEGTVVEGLGTLGASEPMVYMIAVENIVIKGYNVVFKDHRENYTGQQRHMFLMQGVKNVVIEGIAANSSGGDGFYIGATSTIRYSENVKLINVSADNNRRQGISIISGKNIDIINPVLTNTNGEGPGAGLDIEPNGNDQFLEGIRIVNPRTGNNSGPGILVAPNALLQGRVVDVMISGHVDDGSAYGCMVTTVTGPLLGAVTIDNATWKNSRFSAFVARNWSSRGPSVEVNNPVVINSNTSGGTSPNLGACFLIYRAATDQGDPNLGNIHIVRPKITDSRTPRLATSSFCFRDLNGERKILNCSIIDPVKTNSPYNSVVASNSEVVISDKYESLALDFGAYTRYVNYGFYMALYHNQTSTAVRILNMIKVNSGFPEVTIEVRAAYAIKIIPDPTDNILPLSTGNGKFIQSNVVGSRITLKKRTDNSWFVKEMVGTWTVQP